MEQRFGHDLSRVRIHTDATAATSVNAVHSRAYTVGSDIVFAEGRYDPRSASGRTLLAHELIHTIQQSEAATAGVSSPIQIAPDTSEHEPAAQRQDPFVATAARLRHPVLQRQPEPPKEGGEPVITVFVADPRQRKDKAFARREARADATRIRKVGSLSPDDRSLVNAKLRFFEGAAWKAYSDAIRPVLLEVTREQIEMPAEPGGAEGADEGGPADTTNLEQDMRDILGEWKEAAKDGVSLFVTQELSSRLDALVLCLGLRFPA